MKGTRGLFKTVNPLVMNVGSKLDCFHQNGVLCSLMFVVLI